jgi:hypothetical protein
MKTYLGLLLCLIGLPAVAADLQFDITGDAESNTGVEQAFRIDFTVDTLSGAQSYALGGGCVNSFSMLGGSISNVSATIGGQSVWNAAGASGVATGQLESGCGGPLAGGLGVVGSGSQYFLFGFRSAAPVGLNPNDPLAGLLTGFNYGDGAGTLGGNWNLDDLKVQVNAVGVPEPDYLALIVLGLAAVAWQHRYRLRGVRQAINT